MLMFIVFYKRTISPLDDSGDIMLRLYLIFLRIMFTFFYVILMTNLIVTLYVPLRFLSKLYTYFSRNMIINVSP